MPEEIKIDMPIKPLSVNQAWQGQRFKSKLYKQYEKEVAYQLRAPRGPGFGSPDHMEAWIKINFDDKYREKVGLIINGLVEIHYVFYLKYWKTTDCDNLVKVIQDLIVKHGYIEDDRKIMRYVIEKQPSEESRMEIEIRRFRKGDIWR